MPQLPLPVSQPNIKKLYLPSTSSLPLDDQAWVDLDTQPMSGRDLTAGVGVEDDVFGHWLARRILAWNFVDEEGKPVQVTYENVTRLGQENLVFLAQQPFATVPALTDEQKKT